MFQTFLKNTNFLKMKIMYFLTFAGMSPLATYGPTIAKQLGFPGSAVGFIFSLSVVVSIFGRLLFGYLADRFRLHKILLIMATLICACAILTVALFPQQLRSAKDVVYIGAENDTSFELCFSKDDEVKQRSSLLGQYEGKICEIYCQNKIISTSFAMDKNANVNSSIESTHKITTKGNFSCLGVHKIDKFTIHETASESIIGTISCQFENRESKSFVETIALPLFWLYCGSYITYFTTFWIMGIIMDTICFQILEDDGKGDFGSQRMFASIGWGISALFSGILTDYVSRDEDLKNYLPTLLVSSLFLIVTALLVGFFRSPKISVTDAINCQILSKVLMNGESAVFAWWCFITGVGMAVQWQYSSWVIEDISSKDQQPWTKSLQGMSMLLNCLLGDIPIYSYFDRLKSKIGYSNCMTLSLLLNALRLFGYSVINNPIWVLVIAVLDGFSFGLCYSIIASYSNSISTPETKTTFQAIFNSVFDGIGTSVGGIFFGFVYDWYGGSWTFQSCSIMMSVCACLHAAVHLVYFNNYSSK